MKLRTAGEECLRLRGEFRCSWRKPRTKDDGWERATYRTFYMSCHAYSHLNVRYVANDHLARTTIISQLKDCDRMTYLIECCRNVVDRPLHVARSVVDCPLHVAPQSRFKRPCICILTFTNRVGKFRPY